MDTLIQKEYPYLYMHIKHCTLSGDDRHICHSNNYQTELDSNKLVIELNAFLGGVLGAEFGRPGFVPVKCHGCLSMALIYMVLCAIGLWVSLVGRA